MKRDKAEPLLNDVVLCVQMGWTWDQLQGQPVRFVERLQTYLNAVADKQSREQDCFESEIRRVERVRF